MLKKSVLVVLILVATLFAISFYLGAFNSVTLEKAVTGPYKIVCLDHIGPYKNIGKKIQDVKKLLDNQEIIPISACGIYYDDPRSVPSDKLRSKVGWLVEEEIDDIEILEEVSIPEREVLVAKVKAHPVIAPAKIYPKINKWLTANNFNIDGPSLEIYHDKRFIEVHIPIAPKLEEV